MIKNYKSFLENNQSTEFEITKWLDERKVKNYKINDDLTINVDWDVNLSSRINFDKIPYKFKSVSGDFNCSFNNLKTLENCPDYVSGSFLASNNFLENFNYLPKCDELFLHDNKFTSLKGISNLDFDLLDLTNNSIFGCDEITENNIKKIYLYKNPIDDFLNCAIGTIRTDGMEWLRALSSNDNSEYLLKQKVLFIKYLQEYNVIEGNKIFLDRLDDALYMIDLEIDKEKVIESIRKLDSYNVI